MMRASSLEVLRQISWTESESGRQFWFPATSHRASRVELFAKVMRLQPPSIREMTLINHVVFLYSPNPIGAPSTLTFSPLHLNLRPDPPPNLLSLISPRRDPQRLIRHHEPLKARHPQDLLHRSVL